MRIGLSIAVAVLATAPALAAPSTSIKVETSTLGVDETVIDSTTSGPQSFSGSPGPHTYFASAAPGVVKVQASTIAPFNFGPCCTNLVNSIGVTASYTDVITVNAPGISSGSFVATLLIDGLLAANASGPMSSGVVGFATSQTTVRIETLVNPVVFDFSFTHSNYNGFIGGGGSLSTDPGRYTGPPNGVFNFTIPFENLVGQTVTLSVSCGGNARALQSGDAADTNCDYANTVVWGGISAVFDENNAPVTNFTVTGQNGDDYVQSFAPAVPEPASWAMLIAGFGLVGAVARRQKRAQRA